MLKRLFSLSWLILLLVSVFVFESCRTEPQADGVVTASDEPVIITTRLRGNPDKLNPLASASATSRKVHRHIFPVLLNYDPKTTKLTPMLAKSMPEVKQITEGKWAGGESYTYEIHEAAVWDNGSPVQASDYIFTMKLVNNPKITGITAAYRGIFSFLRDVEVDPDNPKKFTVYTDKPYLDALAATGAWIYPEYAYDPKGLLREFSLEDLSDPKKSAELAEKDPKLAEFAEEFMLPKYSSEKGFVVGCGAYTLEEWEPSQRILLKKKENWWGEALADEYPLLSAYPEELVFKIVGDQNAAMSLAKEGGVDVLSAIPVTSFLEAKENKLMTDQYNFFNPPTLSYNYIGINGATPKLKEKEVRRALAHLLNVEGINKDIYVGMGTPMASPIDFFDYANKALKPIEFNVEKAKTLLENNGWKDTDGNGIRDKQVDGKKVELNLNYFITPGNNVSSSMALYFKEDAKKAGVNIEIVTKEVNVLRKAFATKDFELFASGHSLESGYYDPYQHWHTKSRSNIFSFGNANTDAIIESLRKEVDLEKRTKLYQQFAEILYEEQPYIIVNNAQERIMISKKIKNGFGSKIKPGYFENYFHY